MKLLKQFIAIILSGIMINSFNMRAAYADGYEDKVYAHTVFDDAKTAEKISDMVILSVGANFGFINNVKNKISESKNLAPYRVAQEIYIPVKYTAKGLGFTVTETETGLTVKSEGVNQSYTEENCEIKNGALFAKLSEFCRELDKIDKVIDDTIIITDKNNPFDDTNKNLTQQIKTALSYEWNSYQIHAYGYTTGVFVHPKNPEVVWVRTDVGGAYKLDLESDRWICKTDSISGFNELGQSMWMHQPVEALAFDPNDENTVYIAVGNSQFKTDILGAIYKTTDGGESWKMLGLRKVFYGSHPARMYGEMLAVDPNNSNVIYCGTYYDGVWRSEDGGETWSHVDTIPNGVRGTHDFAAVTIAIDERKMQNGKSADVYIGVVSEGIYHSSDGGATFTLMPKSPAAPQRMRFFDGNLYVASGNKGDWVAQNMPTANGFYRFVNEKWENIIENDGLPNQAIGEFYINDNNPDNIVLATRAFTYPRKTYRTMDGGKTWDEYTQGDALDSNTCCFAKDPKSENGILITWGFGVSKILDTTAEKLETVLYDAGIEELMFRDIKCLPEGSKLSWVAGACDKSCILSRGLGTDEWEIAKAPTHNFSKGLDFCESDANIIVRSHVGHSKPPGKIIITDNSGESWKVAATYEGIMTGNVAVGASKQANGYPIILSVTTTENNAKMYRSKDLGESWEEISVPFVISDSASDIKYLISDRVNGNVFYFWSNDGFIYRTMDGGSTWNKISAAACVDANQYFDAPFGLEGHVWVCQGKNGISYSTDYGVRWNRLSDFSRAVSVTFGKEKPGSRYPTVFIMGTYKGEQGIFRSDDYGKTWSSVASSFSYGGATESTYMGGDRTHYGRIWITTNGRGVFYGQPTGFKEEEPKITVDNELNSVMVDEILTVTGRINVKAEVRVNYETVKIADDGYFKSDVKLAPGENRIPVAACDENGKFAETVWLNVVYDPSFIDVKVNNENLNSNKREINISGKTNRPVELTINNEKVNLNADNTFTYSAYKQLGENKYTIQASAGEYSKTYEFIAVYDTTAPVIEYAIDKEITGDGVVVSGKLSEPGEVRINGAQVKVYSDNTFKSFLQIKHGEYPVVIQARDLYGNVSKPIITSVMAQKFTDYTVHDGTILHTSADFKMTGDVYKDFGELPYTCNLVYSGETQNVTSFALRWDEEALYVGARVYDEALRSDGANYYDRDCIEIYIDGTNAKVDSTKKTDTYTQFLVPFEGSMTDGAERVTQITEFGFDIEVKIPWAKVGKGVTVTEGHKIGLDIDNCDTAGTTREAQVGWNGNADSYKRTDKYATMTLVK